MGKTTHENGVATHQIGNLLLAPRQGQTRFGFSFAELCG